MSFGVDFATPTDYIEQAFDAIFDHVTGVPADVRETLRPAFIAAHRKGDPRAEAKAVQVHLTGLDWDCPPFHDFVCDDGFRDQQPHVQLAQEISRRAYALAQWDSIKAVGNARPWLRYVAVTDQRTHPDHLALHATVRRWDDPWWRDHFPPQCAGCRCRVMQLSDRDLERRGWTPI